MNYFIVKVGSTLYVENFWFNIESMNLSGKQEAAKRFSIEELEDVKQALTKWEIPYVIYGVTFTVELP